MDKELEDNLKGKFGGSDFSVPENYFEQLNRDIQTRISVDKLRALTSHHGFTVPPAYFEQLTPKILQAIQHTPAKTVKTVRLWQSDLFKYATAACFILVAAFGFYVNNQSLPSAQNSTATAQEQMLFEIDEEVIIEQLQQERVVQKNGNVSDLELENYILNNYSQSDIVTNL